MSVTQLPLRGATAAQVQAVLAAIAALPEGATPSQLTAVQTAILEAVAGLSLGVATGGALVQGQVIEVVENSAGTVPEGLARLTGIVASPTEAFQCILARQQPTGILADGSAPPQAAAIGNIALWAATGNVSNSVRVNLDTWAEQTLPPAVLIASNTTTAQASAMAATPNFFYISGGTQGSFPTNAVRRISTTATAWTAVANMPSNRRFHTLIAVGRKLYAVGGTLSDTAANLAIDEFDENTGAWTTWPAALPSFASRAVLLPGGTHILAVDTGAAWVLDLANRTVTATDAPPFTHQPYTHTTMAMPVQDGAAIFRPFGSALTSAGTNGAVYRHGNAAGSRWSSVSVPTTVLAANATTGRYCLMSDGRIYSRVTPASGGNASGTNQSTYIYAAYNPAGNLYKAYRT